MSKKDFYFVFGVLAALLLAIASFIGGYYINEIFKPSDNIESSNAVYAPTIEQILAGYDAKIRNSNNADTIREYLQKKDLLLYYK